MSYTSLLLLGILSAATAFYSLRLGHEYDRKVRETISKPKHGFSPRVCLIMACKGDEPGLTENIKAILQQDYSDYYTLIVTDTATDPAYTVAESVITQSPNGKATLITSAGHEEASGKVAALLTGLQKCEGWAEVFAFIDSDAFVPSFWLKELVDPLKDPRVGATTGFRWYFATDGEFWAHVQSAWNASGTNLLFNDKYSFPWGGAMAVRAETLQKIKIERVWEKAISDDLSLNYALRAGGYKISFLPQCTVATFTSIKFADLIKWATNQVTLVKAYNRPLWTYALVAYLFSNLASVLGAVCLIGGLLYDSAWFIPAFLLLVPNPLVILRSKARYDSFKIAMPHFRSELNKTSRLGSIASLIVPWIMTYCIFKSSQIDEIEWRGRRYSLTGKMKFATS